MIKNKENNMGRVEDMGVINQKRENVQGTTQSTKMSKSKKKICKRVTLTHDYK
jgi:tryptophanyl-tRNA synthetase